jgi:TolB protein
VTNGRRISREEGVSRVSDSRFASGWISVAGLLVACAVAAPAQASFPGKNGAIVYGWSSGSRYNPVAATSIRTVNPRTGRVRVLRDCPPSPDAPVGYPVCGVSAPRYSPDGLRIAITTAQFTYPPAGPWETRPGLSVMSPDGTPIEDRGSAQGYHRLAWSPDGGQLLLQRWITPGGGDPSSIFLAALDGTELSQVTPEWTQAPDWSSTADIAFDRYTDLGCLPGCRDIFVTRLGETPRRITYRGGSSPSWSPHGTKLAFERARDIHIIGRDGRGLRRLTRRGGYSPSWSPDGKWIAFIRERDIYVVRSTGRRLRRLVDTTGYVEDFGGAQVDSLDWQPLPRP